MFRVLNLGDPEWIARVMALPLERRDIHFDQRMLAPWAATYGWRAGLALTEGVGDFIIQPVLISNEHQLRHAYNFGGPIGSANSILLHDEHNVELSKWAQSYGATNQYCTLTPPLIKAQLCLLPTAEYIKDTVVMDLNSPDLRGTTRRAANKAQGAGVTVGSYPLDHIKLFHEIYEKTMQRNNAAEHWKFSLAFFQAYVKYLKPILMLATYKDRIEAGCLIAYNSNYQTAYYHFAGSLNTYPSLGISQMMVLSASELLRSMGIRYLNLGGGRTNSSNDGLLVFKSGFSKLRGPVYTYKADYGKET